MSKLIQMLEKVGQQAPAPLGFGAMSRGDSSRPNIALVGRSTPEELSWDPGLADAPVDGLLLLLSDWKDGCLDGVSSALQDRLWGASLAAMNADVAAKLKDKGCDFVVFEVENSSADVLNDGELGKLMAIGPQLSEEVARAIYDLPIDGVAFTPGSDLLPLTIKTLLEVQASRCLVDKPFLMAAPINLGPGELEAFRSAAISGLVIDLSSADKVASLKEAIDKLPRRHPRPARADAIIPRLIQESTLAEDEYEDEEPDEDSPFP